MDFVQGPKIGAAIPHQSAVASLSYHEDGKHLFAAADKKLYLIDAQDGKCDKPAFRCEQVGISSVSSTHHDHCVLFTGTAREHRNIHYWSLYDNKILRKFRGHTDAITNLSMSPSDDMFLTASKDRTVRLWNVQQAGGLAKMDLPTDTDGTPHTIFDSTGMVFAVMAQMRGGQGNYIHLYDVRNFAGGAFSEMKVEASTIQQAMQTQRVTTSPANQPITWKTMDFNPSGNRILIEADPGITIVLDGYNGTVQRIFQSKEGKTTSACFTPDDQSVLVANDSGKVDCWNIQSGTVVKTLEGHLGPVGQVKCNPKYAQIASSCTNTLLWIW
mmetsp:Transcript_30010/g.72061  ORF Transcript_30010/g.72061 Transcript_30010/m.72061 type:complete len:328 (+) Transcript_30010:72-1055(+)